MANLFLIKHDQTLYHLDKMKQVLITPLCSLMDAGRDQYELLAIMRKIPIINGASYILKLTKRSL